MPEPIGEIPIEITGDLSFLEKALQAAQNLASEWAAKLAGAFNEGFDGVAEGAKSFEEGIKEWIEHPLDKAAGAVTGFVESLGPLGVAAVAAAGAFAFIGKEITDLVLEEGAAAEAMSNFANKLNIPFEEAKKLSEMADIAGVSIDSLSRVSMRLADALENPATSGKKVNDALQKMGVYASDSGEALLKLLEKLSQIPDATERIAAAHEVMGRSAVQLEPLLRDYEALGNAIDDLGGKLDSEAIAKLKAADDAADKLGIAWAHLKEGLAATFTGPVTAGLELLTKLITTEPKGSLADQITKLRTELLHLNETAADTPKSVWLMLGVGPESEGGSGTQIGGKSRAAEDIEKQIEGLKALQEAQQRSKEYNDELDKSNMIGERAKADAVQAAIKAQKEAEAQAKRTAAEVVKAAAAYRVLFLNFDAVSTKLQEQKNIKFEKDLYPPDWFKQQKELLANLDKLHTAMDLEQSALRAKASIKEIVSENKGVIELADAFKSLGGDSSQKLSDNLTQASKNFNALQADAGKYLVTSNDVAVAWNKVLQAQLQIGQEGEKTVRNRLNLEIQLAELTGKDASAQIEKLVQMNNHTLALQISTHALGDVYADINKSFLDVFDNLDKGLVKLITSGGSVVDMLKGIGQTLEQDIVGSFVHGITQGLKAAFINSGAAKAVDDFFAGIFKDIFGGLFKSAATTAPAVAATTANTTAITANTAAITALTAALPGASAAQAATGGASGGGAGSLGGLASGVTAISSAVTAITSVLQYLQQRRMEQDIGRIEVTTRGMLNQLISLQTTFNTYLPEIADRLLGIWGALTGGASGGGSGSGGGVADVVASSNSLADSLTASVEAADDYTQALQTTASTAYSLDEAVSSATDSLYNLADAVAPDKRGVPALLGGGSSVPDALAALNAPPAFMQGAMLPHSNIPIQYGSIAPVVTGGAVGPGGGASFGNRPTVAIYAVDPNGRDLASATQKGLEEIGIRTR